MRFQKHFHKGREICRGLRHVTGDVEVFFRPVGFSCLLHHTSVCLGIKLACRGSEVSKRIRILTHQDLSRKPPNGIYNQGHSGNVTRDMALYDTSQVNICIIGHIYMNKSI